MKDKIGAIIIGGHFQGLGVVRALARKGVEVVIIDSEPCIARFSRHAKRFYRSPNIRNPLDYLDFIEGLCYDEGLEGWVIFPTDDETVYFLSRNHDQLSEMFRLITPRWEVTKYAYNKKHSYRLATSLEIPIPRTYYPECTEDLEKIDCPFPLIIKPTVMRDFFRVTGKKVFRARNRDELVTKYLTAASIIDFDEILVQEEIPDVAKHLYSFCPFFKKHHTKARIIGKRSRQHPMDFGQASTYAETVDIPVLEELGERFLSAIDYYGLCEVEFIEDPRDGTFKFLEVNPRIWGWHTLAIRAGVNLPYMVYLDRVDKALEPVDFQRGVKWVRLTTDVPTVAAEILKGRMRLNDYFRSLRGEKEFAVISMNDPLPFIGELFLLPYLALKRGF